MLQLTITIFLALLGFSLAIVALFRTTINGLFTTQKSDYETCKGKIQESLNVNFPELEKVLSDNFHRLSPTYDGVDYLTKQQLKIICSISLNIMGLLSFWYVCKIMGDFCNIKIEDAFQHLQYIAFIGIAILAVTVIFGLWTIHQVDSFDQIKKVSLYKELKKLKDKL